MPTPDEIIRAARIRLSESCPYLAPALWTVRVVESAECRCPVSGAPTMGVSEAWTLHYHPDCAAWPLPALETLWLHEVWHLLRGHAARAKALGVMPANAVTWNVAADCEINDGLVTAQRQFPPELKPCVPASFGWPDDLTAEEYYAKVPPQNVKVRIGGSGADGLGRPWETGGDAPGEAGQQQPGRAVPAELIRQQVAEEIAKARGTVPEEWKRWAGQHLTPRTVPWETVFRAVVGRIVSAGRREDYSFAVPARRELPGGYILPGQFGTLPHVCVGVDTSGSMGEEQLQTAVGILESVLEHLGRTYPMTVMACDAAVHETKQVLSGRNVTLTGGGGTDMRELIAAAQQLRPQPQVLVLVTDCYTPWPERQPGGMQLVVVRVGDGEVPPWATVVDAR